MNPIDINPQSTGRDGGSVLSRRRFLAGLASTFAGSMLVPSAEALAKSAEKTALSFYHTHTGEEIELLCDPWNLYDGRVLHKFSHFLRDHRNDRSIAMDPGLLDILYSVALATGSKGTFEVISGYRSPQTNAMLRTRTSGVAKNSLHMQGKAIDVRLTDVSTKTLQKVSMALKQGGVGYYKSSNFVHLDTGRVRYW